MGYRYQPSGQQAQGDEPFLSIIEAVIYEGDAPAKTNSASAKSRPCLAQLLRFLASSHSYVILYGSAFCSYMEAECLRFGSEPAKDDNFMQEKKC